MAPSIIDMPPVCLQSTMMAAWRNVWVITLAGGTCTTITQLLQIQVFDRLYDRMVTGGDLTGPCVAFKPPRRRHRRRCQQHYQHYNHQRKNEPGHRGHLWTVCSCCNNLALIVARRSKIGTALKFSAWYDDMNAEWSARAYIQVLKVCENSNRASSIVIYVCD